MSKRSPLKGYHQISKYVIFFTLIAQQCSLALGRNCRRVRIFPHYGERTCTRAYLGIYYSKLTLTRTHCFQAALNDFITTYVSPEDLTKSILPTIDKSFLRSPEYSLPTITQFFSAYRHPLSTEAFQKLQQQLISNSKSSNPLIRTNCVQLFKAVVSLDANISKIAVTELLTLPKTGKTAGPDHRCALYSMLSFLVPADDVSSTLVQSSIPLLAKETNDTAISTLASSLPSHISYVVKHTGLPADITQLIAKEMANAKPAIRRAFVGLAGKIFFDEQDVLQTEKGVQLAKGLLPSFEAALKSASLNPASGPFEGYVALSVLLGPFSKSGKFSTTFTFLSVSGML